MRKFVLCLVMVLTFASPAAACIGARQAAMGWCGVAIANDASVAYWNPSRIPFLDSQASLDVFISTYYNAPRLWYTSQSFINGKNIGVTHGVSLNREYFMFSYAYALSDRFALSTGLSFDFNSREYQGNGLLLSGTYQGDKFTFACLAQDMNIRPSVAITTSLLGICFEVYDMLNHYGFQHVRVGGQFILGPIFISSGYNTKEQYATFGVGININEYTVCLSALNDIYGLSINNVF